MSEIDVDVPDDSIFDAKDYLRMYEVASTPKQYEILCTLADHDELSTSELSAVIGERDNALHYPIRTLQDVGLLRNRREPNTGTTETYSYYELTDMGRIVLTEGIQDGVETLARQEAEIADKYSK